MFERRLSKHRKWSTVPTQIVFFGFLGKYQWKTLEPYAAIKDPNYKLLLVVILFSVVAYFGVDLV